MRLLLVGAYVIGIVAYDVAKTKIKSSLVYQIIHELKQ